MKGRRLRCLAVVVLWLAAAGLRPEVTSAQTVLVLVSNVETAEPIFGALAHLVDDAGKILRTVLTDERGRALFAAVPPARYRVRAEMIGMATDESAPFDVTGAATPPQDLRLATSAIHLEGIDVAASSRCMARPSGEGLLIAELWDEARKALTAAAYTDRQGVYRYETMKYERDLDRDGRTILRQDESQREGYMRAPFEALPPEELVEQGFARREGADLLYYAPDANVLLSDPFLDTHCFRLVQRDDQPGVLGLGFEPMGDRRRVVDITGTLWLDDRTAELRWLDYSYWNLGLEIGSADAGGHVEFQRMPAGTWIVPEWWIKMPLLETRYLGDRASRGGLRGFRQSGGRVLEVHDAGGRTLGGRRQTGGIEGLVVDSVGAPLAGARVGVAGSNQEVFTNAEGRYGIVGLSEGTYLVRFVDPRFAPLGLLPPPVSREVILGEMSYLEFHMPSGLDLLLAACRGQPIQAGMAILTGTVVDARTDRPLAGATVRVLWSSLESLGTPAQIRAFLEDTRGFEMTTGADGAYTFCGVPRDAQLTISALVDGVESVPETLRIGSAEAAGTHVIRREVR